MANSIAVKTITTGERGRCQWTAGYGNGRIGCLLLLLACRDWVGALLSQVRKHGPGAPIFRGRDRQVRIKGWPPAIGRRPAHRDGAAMNGAQLLKAHIDSLGLMSGPPAADDWATCQTYDQYASLRMAPGGDGFWTQGVRSAVCGAAEPWPVSGRLPRSQIPHGFLDRTCEINHTEKAYDQFRIVWIGPLAAPSPDARIMLELSWQL